MTNKELATLAGLIARKAAVISHDILKYQSLADPAVQPHLDDFRRDLMEALTVITNSRKSV